MTDPVDFTFPTEIDGHTVTFDIAEDGTVSVYLDNGSTIFLSFGPQQEAENIVSIVTFAIGLL